MEEWKKIKEGNMKCKPTMSDVMYWLRIGSSYVLSFKSRTHEIQEQSKQTAPCLLPHDALCAFSIIADISMCEHLFCACSRWCRSFFSSLFLSLHFAFSFFSYSRTPLQPCNIVVKSDSCSLILTVLPAFIVIFHLYRERYATLRLFYDIIWVSVCIATVIENCYESTSQRIQSTCVCVWVCVCVLFFMMNSHRCILFNKWICDSDRCFLVRSFVRFWMLCALLMCSYKSLVFMVCIWNAANVIMAGVVPLRESLFELKLSWLALTYENVCLCLYIYAF